MDLMTAIAQIPGIGPYLPYLTLAVTIGAALATVLPPPPTSGGFLATLYGVVYHAVSWAALNKGQAANANAPSSAKPPAGTSSIIIFLLATGIVLTACSPASKQAAVSLAPVAVQTLETADPAIAPDVDKACEIATAGADAGAAANPNDQDAQTAKTLAHAACDTKQARAQLTANDKAPVQPNGGSSNWLIKYVLPMAKIALTVAPLL